MDEPLRSRIARLLRDARAHAEPPGAELPPDVEARRDEAEQALGDLGACLDSDDPTLRLAALCVARLLPPNRARPLLDGWRRGEALQGQPFELRRLAVLAYVERFGDEAIEGLRQASRAPSFAAAAREARALAIAGLGALDDRGSEPLLRTLARKRGHDDPVIEEAARVVDAFDAGGRPYPGVGVLVEAGLAEHGLVVADDAGEEGNEARVRDEMGRRPTVPAAAGAEAPEPDPASLRVARTPRPDPAAPDEASAKAWWVDSGPERPRAAASLESALTTAFGPLTPAPPRDSGAPASEVFERARGVLASAEGALDGLPADPWQRLRSDAPQTEEPEASPDAEASFGDLDGPERDDGWGEEVGGHDGWADDPAAPDDAALDARPELEAAWGEASAAGASSRVEATCIGLESEAPAAPAPVEATCLGVDPDGVDPDEADAHGPEDPGGAGPQRTPSEVPTVPPAAPSSSSPEPASLERSPGFRPPARVAEAERPSSLPPAPSEPARSKSKRRRAPNPLLKRVPKDPSAPPSKVPAAERSLGSLLRSYLGEDED